MAARSAKAGSKSAKSHKTNRSREKSQPQLKRAAEQAKMAKARAHPTRLQILAVAHQRPISPSEFAKSHDMPIGTAAHHFRKLVEYGALKLVKKEPASGSVRHMYVGTMRAIYMESEWPTLSESRQSGLVSATLEDFVGVTVDAIESGGFNNRDDFVFTWDEVELDEVAWKKLGEMLRLVWKKVPSLEEETAARKNQGNSDGFTVVVGLAAFELPKTKSPTLRQKPKPKVKSE